MDTIRERISDLITQFNIKGVELAEATSVNASTISRILKGTQIPTADTLYKFAQYFNVTMEYLLTGRESTPENCTDAIQTRDEALLIRYYHQMSEEDQEDFLLIAEMKAGKKKKRG